MTYLIKGGIYLVHTKVVMFVPNIEDEVIAATVVENGHRFHVFFMTKTTSLNLVSDIFNRIERF